MTPKAPRRAPVLPSKAFVDTAGWMMLADASDPRHASAVAWRDAWLREGRSFVTTDYVSDETLTLLRMRLGLEAAQRWWSMVSASSRLRWEAIDVDRAERARAWLFGWRDHAFSFTDCTSFVVMKDLRLTLALTSDDHFRVAGFEIVPRR
jgi:hypothetical protein